MVVHHVHDDTDACFVECLNHLLVFHDSHCAVVGIGGITAFGDVVVFRIIAPVELTIRICFVNSLIVIDGEQVDVGDAKLYKIVNANRLTKFIDKALFGEGKILAFVLRRSNLV